LPTFPFRENVSKGRSLRKEERVRHHSGEEGKREGISPGLYLVRRREKRKGRITKKNFFDRELTDGGEGVKKRRNTSRFLYIPRGEKREGVRVDL